MMCENKYELIKFEDGDFSLDVNVSPNEETVWLNRIELSMLFDRDVKTIGKHINNILKEEYKNVTGVIAKIATTATDGKTWGNKYLERLSVDLKEHGSGYSRSNLFYMQKIALLFTKEEIIQRCVGLIPWRSLITIITKCKAHDEMLWYVNETYNNKWTKTLLENKIKMKCFELRLIEHHDNSIISNDNPLIDEIFNSKLAIDFIDKNKIITEKDLEKELINNITKFILELGKGFAYIGNQYKLKIPNHEYYPDLLFYNYILHSFVIIDLKLTPFQPEYLGKMIFYVNIANDTLKGENDNPTIGLILCKEAENIVMKHSFGSMITPIKVAEYKFIEELPEYLEKRLKAINLNIK